MELSRSNLSDVIIVLQSFERLSKHASSRTLNAGHVYDACQAYLDQYLGLSKKDITGSQFAQLVSLVASAKRERIYEFDNKTLERL